jgi:4'-phosphopantetheinyl transferase EntD
MTHACSPAASLRRHHRLTNPARPSALVAGLFDPGVAAAELREDADSSLLYPAEAIFCAGFAHKRRADFTAGRLCARRALAALGIVDFAIAVNLDRSPRWPPGIVGSISHTGGYCCAVAANAPAFGSIGIDVEIVGRVTAALDSLVFTHRESAFLSALAGTARARAATVIFSGKEAFYKCQHVVTHQWLDFQDVSLEITTPDMLGGTFRVDTAYARLALGPGIELPLTGRFRIERDLAVTAIALRHETDPATGVSRTSANAAAACSRSRR